MEWLMFGLHLFSPKCMVGERVFFKYNHYLYLGRDFKDGTIELWAVAARKPYEWQLHEYNLGRYVLNEWIKPKGFYNYEYRMQTQAQKLFQMLLKSIDDEKKEAHNNAMVEKKNKKVWTREDFVEAGKLGHRKMIAKYGKAAVTFRWEKRDKELKYISFR